MEATFMFRLTPLCAKDDERAPVRRAIWKPTLKIFGVTYIKCSLALTELQETITILLAHQTESNKRITPYS